MLGVIAAMRREAKLLAGSASPVDHTRVRIHTSGIGPDNATAAARLLINDGCSALLSFGLAAALDPALRRGQLLLPDQVRDSSGQCFNCDPLWLQRMRRHLVDFDPASGTLLESPVVVRAVAEKAALSRHGVAVDMESAALARVSLEHQVPFAVLRAVSDGAHQALPTAAGATDAFGSVNLFALMRAIVGQPVQIPALITLGLGTREALATLRDALRRLGPALQQPDSEDPEISR